MQTRSSSKRVTRQSSRASTGFKRQAFAQLEEPLKPKRRKPLPPASPRHAVVPSDSASISILAPPKPIAHGDLSAPGSRDEVARLEKELKRRTADVDRLSASALVMEKEFEVSQRKQMLEFLEEHFSCVLCLEVIAHPVTLPNCGHSLCAICTLKHFFSRFHRPCGTWHENVECPMCRSILIYTPPSTPRNSITFPFVKNRAADNAITSLINKLAGEREVKKKGRGKGKGKAKDDTNDALALWRHGGTARSDWLDRNDRGKTETEFLSRRWSTLDAGDFCALKDRLHV